MMKRSDRKKIGKAKKGQTESFVSELSKRGELNPKHRRDFDQMLDNVAPPIPIKK